MSLTTAINRLSRRVFDHRTYRRRAVDRWLRANRPLLRGRVLDVGSKRAVRQGLFALRPLALGDRWWACDLQPENAPHVVCRAEALPFRPGAFNAVVCSETIEHVEAPAAMLDELYRILRPGGHLLLSAPFLYRVHGDPYDYWRPTEHWLRRHLLGYAYLHIAATGYFASVGGDVLVRATHGTSRRRVYKYLLYPLLPLVWLWVLCERSWFLRSLAGWTQAVQGYVVVARKRGDAQCRC